MCGRVSRLSAGLFAVGSVALQPVLAHPLVVHVAVWVGPGCRCGCPVAPGGLCVLTGLHCASDGPCQENTHVLAPAVRSSPPAEFRISLHTVSAGAVARLVPCVRTVCTARSVAMPLRSALPHAPKGSHVTPGVCGGPGPQVCLSCCSLGVGGVLSPHTPSCPLVSCSCIVQLWLGVAHVCRCLRAVRHVGQALLWSAVLRCFWPSLPWLTRYLILCPVGQGSGRLGVLMFARRSSPECRQRATADRQTSGSQGLRCPP